MPVLVLSLVLGALGVPVAIGGIAGAVAFALIATELFYHAWPPRLARAEAAHAFLGSWEMKRFRATTGRPVPTSIPLAREWLASQPETDENRWVRPEILAWIGEIEEAYEVLGRMPSDTEDERFERQSLKVYLDTVAGADADVDGLAAAAEEIGEPGSDERLRAVAGGGDRPFPPRPRSGREGLDGTAARGPGADRPTVARDHAVRHVAPPLPDVRVRRGRHGHRLGTTFSWSSADATGGRIGPIRPVMLPRQHDDHSVPSRPRPRAA